MAICLFVFLNDVCLIRFILASFPLLAFPYLQKLPYELLLLLFIEEGKQQVHFEQISVFILRLVKDYILQDGIVADQ